MVNFPLRIMTTNPVKYGNQSELTPKVRTFLKHVFKKCYLATSDSYFSLVSQTLSKNILVK